MKSTAKTTISQLNDPIIHLTGSISTEEIFIEDFDSDKKNLKEKIKTEIEILLVSNAVIVNALVSVNEMENIVSPNREKRSTENFLIRFNAVCSLGVEKNYDLTKIEIFINASIKSADPRQYDYFDEKSFATLYLTFEVPKIITIVSTEQIGKIR